MMLPSAVWVALYVAAAGFGLAVVALVVDTPVLIYVGASITSTAVGWLLLRAAILSALRQARSEE